MAAGLRWRPTRREFAHDATLSAVPSAQVISILPGNPAVQGREETDACGAGQGQPIRRQGGSASPMDRPATTKRAASRNILAAGPGLFCAHPPTRRLLAEATARLDPHAAAPSQAVRASVGLGTTAEHVDRLPAAL